MRILILAIGKIRNSDEQRIINRFLDICPLKIEIKEIEIKKKLGPTELVVLEAEKIKENIPKSTNLILLDRSGKDFSSEEFTKVLYKESNITFIIGGAHGLHNNLINAADLTISFGKMTWPHKIARLLLVEQIYRASSIFNNHPYHK